jgi:hypothetical protein
MTDTKNPCTGSSNWKASNNIAGGTPSKKNSTDAINTDETRPGLKRAYTTGNNTIVLVYDEPVDSLSAATLSNYIIDGGLALINASAIAPLFNTVQLKTNAIMDTNLIYTITASNIKDCKGNSIGSANSVRTGLPADPAPGEWVINEILFDPVSNAYDYVEFYNNSKKIFDAAKLYIASRSTSGVISSAKALSASPYYIFPGDYIVETENADDLSLRYMVKTPGNILEIVSPPSFGNDEGDVIALNVQGIIVDEVKYKDDWHFKLIENTEGISLERIDPAGPSQNAANWHSAASTAGYGTPTYKNSHYKIVNQAHATIQITPKIFSPDNDGRDDVATIQYEVAEPGYIATITIYDAAGRLVRGLVRNGTLGIKGYWNWDGLNNNGQQLPIGTYIIFTEMFNLSGKKTAFKNAVVLARHL